MSTYFKLPEPIKSYKSAESAIREFSKLQLPAEVRFTVIQFGERYRILVLNAGHLASYIAHNGHLVVGI